MKLDLSEEDQAFANEVQDFLDRHLTRDLRDAAARAAGTFCDINAIRRWHDILYRQGWVAPHWPRDYGGPGWTLAQRFIFARACALAGAPRTLTFGIAMCGPVIMRFGTDAQKAFYLPRILDGSDRWCQGYSEPGSGSDLASLKTRAENKGDHYIVNGTKIWTTLAHHANKIFCLVRTDPDAKPQSGISFLLIDLASPGVSIQPIVNIAGEHEFNQVFFDDVAVPLNNRIGAEHDGWTVAKYLLEFERGGNYSADIRAALSDLLHLARACGVDDPAFHSKLSEASVELAALEMTELRIMSALSLGQSVGAAASLLKLRGSELVQRVDELALETLGAYAQPLQPAWHMGLDDPATIGPDQGYMVTGRYLYDRAITIYGGTSEVQRNILARASLGL